VHSSSATTYACGSIQAQGAKAGRLAPHADRSMQEPERRPRELEYLSAVRHASAMETGEHIGVGAGRRIPGLSRRGVARGEGRDESPADQMGRGASKAAAALTRRWACLTACDGSGRVDGRRE
jgi:hypothetical protein